MRYPFDRYIYRVADWNDANANGFCDRRPLDSEYAQPLDELLQVVATWKMVMAWRGSLHGWCWRRRSDIPVYLVIVIYAHTTLVTACAGSRIHRQHGNTKDLSAYAVCSEAILVSLAMIVRRPNGDSVALSILSRLMPGTGNTGKLIVVNMLVRASPTRSEFDKQTV